MKGSSLRKILLARRMAAKGPMAPPDDSFRTRWPLLFDLLTRPLVVKGRVVEPMRLTLSIGDGDWVVSLTDGMLCQSLTVRQDTLESVLDHVNHVLSSEGQRWVPWKGRNPKLPEVNGKKGKKPVDNDDVE